MPPLHASHNADTYDNNTTTDDDDENNNKQQQQHQQRRRRGNNNTDDTTNKKTRTMDHDDNGTVVGNNATSAAPAAATTTTTKSSFSNWRRNSPSLSLLPSSPPPPPPPQVVEDEREALVRPNNNHNNNHNKNDHGNGNGSIAHRSYQTTAVHHHNNNNNNNINSSSRFSSSKLRRNPSNIEQDEDDDDDNSNDHNQQQQQQQQQQKQRHSWLLSKLPLLARCVHIARRQYSAATLSGWKMLRLWIVGVVCPMGVVAWTLTDGNGWAVAASLLLLPTVAIVQGSLAIFKYRVQYGDSPLPKAPSHGIVKCINGSESEGVEAIVDRDVADNGGRNKKNHHSNASPLRLLVIGDSLAIGVGQSKCSTPIMPETIAKSLSKAMHGRPVMWTCHGAPGASAGWIVRELERSIRHGQFLQTQHHHQQHQQHPLSPMRGVRMTDYNDDNNDDDGWHDSGISNGDFAVLPGHSTHANNCTTTTTNNNDNRNPGDADYCYSSGESSSSSQMSSTAAAAAATTTATTTMNDEEDEETKTWSDRLKEEKIRFDPNVLGPFDIAIVLTGSNDLKSAFFPFLLTGEDAEFRRQAQLRGGGYGSELTRILQVLNHRMRLRLQTLRETVEAAKEKVLESVDSIRDRLNSHDFNTHVDPSNNIHSRHAPDSDTAAFGSDIDPSRHRSKRSTNTSHDADHGLDATNHTLSSHGALHSSLFPMVVLPGLPARALPIFTIAPLRWLAVPVVDIMDSHKKNLAKQHDGEVLFVEAPAADDIATYACQGGTYWNDKVNDRVLLELRDIKKRRAQRIESDMAEYFAKKGQRQPPELLPHGRKHFSVFSEDGIHPNDSGYDFWGRHIADAIVEEWKRKQDEMGIEVI